MASDRQYMRIALNLARRGYGTTSPNPMVGAVLVRGGQIIGRGWHRRAGEPHAEIEAIRDAARRGRNARGSTLYVTLEPCCTHGRTPPCTDAIVAAGIRKVVVGATDPNPRHSGAGFRQLHRKGVQVNSGLLAAECSALNDVFNYYIVHGTPLVTVKAAMTLDGKIATARDESKWITGQLARNYAMRLRLGADAILVGVNTILADNPSLTHRTQGAAACEAPKSKPLRRIVLDSMARTPGDARVIADPHAADTTIVVSELAPPLRVARLRRRVNVWQAPVVNVAEGGRRITLESPVQVGRGVPTAPPWEKGHPFEVGCDRRSRQVAQAGHRINLEWLLKKLGQQNVTSILVEGGGEVGASFLLSGLAYRVVLFYAPTILGGLDARPAVGGVGLESLADSLNLKAVNWRRVGEDWMLTAKAGKRRRRRTPQKLTTEKVGIRQ